MIINRAKKFSEHFTKTEALREIKFLVLHHVQADSVDHAVAQFQEHKVSSHFLIDENGEVFALVDENDVAYHAGVSYWKGFTGLNKNSIGIEFINKSPFEKRFEPAQMLVGIELCHYLIKKYNIEAGNIVGHSDIAFYPEEHWIRRCFSLHNFTLSNILRNIKAIFNCLRKGKDKSPLNLSGFLDRKQDPSHFFDWKFLAHNNVGIFPEITLPNGEDKKMFSLGNSHPKIKYAKEKLAKIGYRVTNFSEEFDVEMQMLARVFNRRYNPSKFHEDSDCWYLSSRMILNAMIKDMQEEKN